MRIQQNEKLLSSTVVVALLLLTAGTLAAQDVRYNFMPGADFSKYHTYKWVSAGGAQSDQIMDAEIKQAIDSQLAAKGMTKTDGDKRRISILATRPPSIRNNNGMSKAREPSVWPRDRGLVRRSVSGP